MMSLRRAILISLVPGILLPLASVYRFSASPYFFSW